MPGWERPGSYPADTEDLSRETRQSVLRMLSTPACGLALIPQRSLFSFHSRHRNRNQLAASAQRSALSSRAKKEIHSRGIISTTSTSVFIICGIGTCTICSTVRRISSHEKANANSAKCDRVRKNHLTRTSELRCARGGGRHSDRPHELVHLSRNEKSTNTCHDRSSRNERDQSQVMLHHCRCVPEDEKF